MKQKEKALIRSPVALPRRLRKKKILLLKEQYNSFKMLLYVSLSILARVNAQKLLAAYLFSAFGSLCTHVIVAVVLALSVSS